MPIFALPDGGTFLIPDGWWEEAGAPSFVRLTGICAGDENTEFMADLLDIAPPRRQPGVELDYGGFCRERLVRALTQISSGKPLEPLTLVQQVSASCSCPYVLKDGFHRYHACVAFEFTTVPARWGWVPEVA